MRIRERIFAIDPYQGFEREKYESDLRGWGSKHPVFAKLIEELRPSLVIEVGTWKGASAIHMGNLIREAGGKAEIVCVDTWLGAASAMLAKDADERSERYKSLDYRHGWPHLYYTFLRNVVDAGLEDMITPMPQTSDNAAVVLRTLEVQADLVYVDGAHDYDTVLRDLTNYWALVKPGGVLLGDDYDLGRVRKAVNKFVESNKLAVEVLDRKCILRKS